MNLRTIHRCSISWLVCALACSTPAKDDADSEGTSAGTGASSTTSGGEAGSADSGEGSASASSSGGTSTSTGTGGTSGSGTSGGTGETDGGSSEGGETTGDSGGTGVSGDTDESGGTGETGGSSDEGGSDTGGDDGGTGGQACEGPEDCALWSSCCRCLAGGVEDEPPPCEDMVCIQSACDAAQIDEVECRFGHCALVKRHCDARLIECDGPVPECPGGYPEVEGTCYTQDCVPAWACDVVGSCDDCRDGEMCVVHEEQIGPRIVCEPMPTACAGQPTCECAGDLGCTEGEDLCSDPDGVLYCSCPEC